ncbi:MAG: ArsA family ATPase [Acidimicrobiia bacterium]|nr:ArsA family ATPase [Acidimicrobiia bacterium]
MSGPILVTGAGGVGKTTVSAALAVHAARRGLETLVLTVDPAKRLASALGVETLGAEPTANPELPHLWAAMLDAEASWEEIARRHAPPDVADRLVTSEFFRSITRHFPASQSYAAAEKMADYVEARRWDVVIVDTPPAAGGIEFFTAPQELTELVGGRLFRWLTGGSIPGRRELFNLAARPALRIVDLALGSDLLERVSSFLFDLRSTYDGLRSRATEIERHFKKSVVLVVTTSDPAPVAEAARFFQALPAVARAPAAVVFNRALPTEWEKVDIPDGTARPLARNLALWAREARRQETVRDEFSARYRVPVARIAWQATAPTDLDSLDALVADSGVLADLL